MCVSGAVLVKAGADVNSDLSDGTVLIGTDFAVDVWIVEAESMVNVMTRRNFTDDYSGLNDDVKYILQDAVSSYAAIKAVNYDPSGYETITISENIINVNRDNFLRCIGILRDQKAGEYIDGA